MSVSWTIVERAHEVVLEGYLEIVAADPGDGSAAGLPALVAEQATYWRRVLTGTLGDERAIRMSLDVRTRAASAEENRYLREVAGPTIARLRDVNDHWFDFMVAHQMPAEVRSTFATVAAWARRVPERALNYVVPYGAPTPRDLQFELGSVVTSGSVLLYGEPDRRQDAARSGRRFGGAHEIGHLLGLADLYRHSASGDPTCPPNLANNIMCWHDMESPRVQSFQVREAAEFALREALIEQRHPLALFEPFRRRMYTTWTTYHVRGYRDEGSGRFGFASIPL
jgi:hypothetical protein